jgi:dTDP-4-dehydrorhamnose 3,5-epimerase
MTFLPTIFPDAWLIDPQRFDDERGFFARTWCRRDFEQRGLETDVAQCGIAFNTRKGTLRGMHFQTPPHEEVKLVRCTMGAIYDVILDLRPNSPTYLKHQAFELSADNRHELYIPRGFAHGYLTLRDNAEVAYQMSQFYHPDAGRGVRWNDPAFAIQWPTPVNVINERDAAYPDYKPSAPSAGTTRKEP